MILLKHGLQKKNILLPKVIGQNTLKVEIKKQWTAGSRIG